MSPRQHEPCVDAAEPGAGTVCCACGEPWPCEVARLRGELEEVRGMRDDALDAAVAAKAAEDRLAGDLRLLNEANHSLLRAGDEQRAEIRRLREAVSSWQSARSEMERQWDADRAEIRRLAAERDTVRNLYERAEAEAADAREDLRNTTLAWNGQIDLAERLAGEGLRLSEAISDFLAFARSDDATKSASIWAARLDDLEAALREPRAIPHVVLPLDVFAEIVDGLGGEARVPRLARYLLAALPEGAPQPAEDGEGGQP